MGSGMEQEEARAWLEILDSGLPPPPTWIANGFMGPPWLLYPPAPLCSHMLHHVTMPHNTCLALGAGHPYHTTDE